MANRMKPYSLDEKKQSKSVLQDVDVNQWKEVICAGIMADKRVLVLSEMMSAAGVPRHLTWCT